MERKRIMKIIGLWISSRVLETPIIKEKLMNNSINGIQSLISNLTPPSSITADIEILCAGFEKIFAGQPADMLVFSQRLARVLEWVKVRPLVEDPSNTTGWRAQYAGLPALGGTLTCQNDVWELMVSFDANHTAYMGSWGSLRPGEEDHGGIFSIENTSSGQVLVLDTGQSKQQLQLVGSERIAWGSIGGFLKNIQNVDPMQTDTQTDTQTPGSLPSENPDLEISSNDAPTILATPKRQQNESVNSPVDNLEPELVTDSDRTIVAGSARQNHKFMSPPTEISEKKPVPTEILAKSQSGVWQCTCGNTNIGPVCLKCGKGKPASASVEKSALAQKIVCRQCGGELSKGARFCRKCGTKVLD
jgi:ribosomal protein L40E